MNAIDSALNPKDPLLLQLRSRTSSASVYGIPTSAQASYRVMNKIVSPAAVTELPII